ncbi:hemicentin-1-like [Anabrus simplex]|uniref:hemicentin-1-like n=1 Tax=Anabrus simplex TaxID=316456 RepID=UPI0035A37C1E
MTFGARLVCLKREVTEVGPVLETTDPQKFINQLEAISVFGGGDCGEKSLQGLKLAITNSLKNSYIFLFTDAGAKDYYLLPEIEHLIQQKQSQVVFMLTGDCGDYNNLEYQVYERIAAMSFGQVFNLWKSEVYKVLEFVKFTVQEKNKVNIMSDEVPGPGRKTYSVPVDSQMDSMTVSLSGKDPVIHINNPHGKEIRGTPVLEVHSGLVINVINPEQGIWLVFAGSSSNHHVRVSGGSKFSFAYGFSNYSSGLLETASLQPEIGTETALLVKVTSQSQLYHLTTVKLKDRVKGVIQKLDLYPVKGVPGLYRTPMFIPPNKQFYLEVLGVDNKGFTLERISQTEISPKNAGAPPDVNTLPKVTLIQGVKQSIWCHVESKTNYTVSWSKAFRDGKYVPVTGPRFTIQSNGNLVIYPVISLDKGWYKCTAENKVGKTSKEVYAEVRTPPQETFKVIVTPRKAFFVQGETIHLFCKAEGRDKFELQWTKKGKVIEPTDPRLVIPVGSNALNLHLVNASEYDEGRYECTAKSNGIQDVGAAEIVYVQYPTVNRTAPGTILSNENTSVVLHCSIQGKPKPTITWLKNGRKIETGRYYKVLPDGDLSIPTVQLSNAGAYTCIGKNSLGHTQQTINLEVGGPPEFTTIPEYADIPFNSNGSIPCDVHGNPKPEIIWQRLDGKELDPTRFSTEKSCTLTISGAKYEDRGSYFVTAQNSFGAREMLVRLAISGVEPPRMGNIYQETKIPAGDTVVLPCDASGYPPLHIQWSKGGLTLADFTERTLVLKNVQQESSGTYQCQASNVAGKVEKEFHVIVVDNTKVKN